MPMKYAYHDLSPGQFEDLLIVICQQLFGIAVQGFSTGPDGGRDAKFVGTAEQHPSKAEPWKGTTIIQAKHTLGYNATFSDSDFHSENSENTVLGKEIPRIKKLRTDKELDHYFLASNRRLSGLAEAAISKHIVQECGIPRESVYLVGIEQLDLYLKTYPQIVMIAGINAVDSPLLVSPDELADIIEALAEHKNVIGAVIASPSNRTGYDLKNQINNMTPDYARQQRKNYLKETRQIQQFLADPRNVDVLQQYETVVDEFQLQIIAKRKDYQTFDAIMEYLARLLFERDPVLNRNKKLTRAMLFYMYWNCDIGLSDAATI
jgi:hypothetical protein